MTEPITRKVNAHPSLGTLQEGDVVLGERTSGTTGLFTVPALSGGGGAVDSVNGQTGVVVLDADDIEDTSTTNKFVTAADITVLGNTSGTNTGDNATNTQYSGLATSKQDVITGLTASGAELNILDGATLTTTELNYVDGVTSAIQTQLDGKAASLGTDDNYVTDAEKTKLSNLSGTNTGDQNIFQTISVSGQSNVVADTTTDTLTLVAGSNITLTTNATTDTITIASSGGTVPIIPPTGRLTLATATPVMVTDQAAKTTIYYALYNGNTIPIYDGSNWTNTTYTELSVDTTDTTKSPAAIGASKVNDWFVWNDSGTVRLGHGPDWTNDTTRSAGTALTLVNGIYLNNASITNGPAASRGTYVGTTRSNSSSQLDWILGGDANDGSPANLFVWNMYNRVNAGRMIRDTRSSHNWTTASFQGINGTTGMRVTLVRGLDEDTSFVSFTMISITTSNAIPLANGIGIDSTSVNSANTSYTYFGSVNSNIIAGAANYTGYIGQGVHYMAALEYGGTNATQYGVSSPAQNGMCYLVRM
jgi:hypothetical protein